MQTKQTLGPPEEEEEAPSAPAVLSVVNTLLEHVPPRPAVSTLFTPHCRQHRMKICNVSDLQLVHFIQRRDIPLRLASSRVAARHTESSWSPSYKSKSTSGRSRSGSRTRKRSPTPVTTPDADKQALEMKRLEDHFDKQYDALLRQSNSVANTNLTRTSKSVF